MKRTLGELIYDLVTDERTMCAGEPWGWRQRWRYFRVACMARRFLRLVLRNKKDAGIVYPDEMTGLGLTASVIAGCLIWWMDLKDTEVISVMLQREEEQKRWKIGAAAGHRMQDWAFWWRDMFVKSMQAAADDRAQKEKQEAPL